MAYWNCYLITNIKNYFFKKFENKRHGNIKGVFLIKICRRYSVRLYARVEEGLCSFPGGESGLNMEEK